MQPLFVTGHSPTRVEKNKSSPQRLNKGKIRFNPENLTLQEEEVYSNNFTSRLQPNGQLNFVNKFKTFTNEEYPPFFDQESEFLELVACRKNEEEDLEHVKKEDLIKDLPPNFKIDFDDDSDQESDSMIKEKKEIDLKVGNEAKLLSTKSKNFRLNMPPNQPRFPQNFHQPPSRLVPSHLGSQNFSAPQNFVYPPQQNFRPQGQFYFNPNLIQGYHFQGNPHQKNTDIWQGKNSEEFSNFNKFVKDTQTSGAKEEKITVKILKSIVDYSKKKRKGELGLSKMYRICPKDYNRILEFVKKYKNFGKKLTIAISKNYTSLLSHSSKTLIKEKYNPNKKEKMIVEQMKTNENDHYPQLKGHQLKQISLEDKEISSKFQVYLRFADEEEIEVIFQKMKNYFYELSFDKFGNYITQIMVEKSKNFTEFFVEKYCVKNLDTMIANQFSSRVLQKILATKNEKFQKFCLEKFKKNFFKFVNNLSSVIFATKLVSESSNEKDFYFIENILKESNGAVIVKNPNVLRILVALFSKFSDDILKRMFNILKKYTWNLLNDKFGNYILQKVIERNMTPFKGLIEDKCIKNAPKLILKKYPRYILLRLIEFDETGIFCERLFKVICFEQSPFFVKKKLVWKKETSCLVLLSLFGSRRENFEGYFEKFVKILFDDFEGFDNGKNQCKNFFKKKQLDGEVWINLISTWEQSFRNM